LAVLVDFSVAPDSDLERVEQVALEAAREVLSELPDRVVDVEPLVRFQGLSDWAMRFRVIVRCGGWSDQFLVRHELIKRLHRRFAEAGIMLPLLRHVIHSSER
jgi:small-conductance mechanosensitive channel